MNQVVIAVEIGTWFGIWEYKRDKEGHEQSIGKRRVQ
jgi:hypothetical protein